MLNIISFGASLALAGIFFSSGVTKLRWMAAFREQVADYEIVAYRASKYVAWILAGTEVASAALVAVPSTRVFGLGLIGLLLTLFAAVVGSVLARDKKIACGCFGVGGQADLVGPHTLVRIALLLALIPVAVLIPASGLGWSPVVCGVLLTMVAFQLSTVVRVASYAKATRREIVLGLGAAL